MPSKLFTESSRPLRGSASKFGFGQTSSSNVSSSSAVSSSALSSAAFQQNLQASTSGGGSLGSGYNVGGSSSSGMYRGSTSNPLGISGGGSLSAYSSLTGADRIGSSTAGSSNASGQIMGPPDVYPQDPSQKEDELTAVHVKQGFTHSYSSMVNEEYASVSHKLSPAVNMNKVLSELKTIQNKKEEINTLPDVVGKRRQILNTKDHFWLVTGRNKAAVDNWFKDLGGNKPLHWLAKRVPVFNKREELLTIISDNQVPLTRAVWLLKMTAGYAFSMQETNKTKKRQTSDPSMEWTSTLVRFLKDLLSEVASSANSTSQGPGLSDTVKMENFLNYKKWTYMTSLCEFMYHQGLLERDHFLSFIVDTIEKYRHPDEPAIQLMLPIVLQYTQEFVKSELLSRKLCYHCSKKITTLVSDTEAVYANNPNQHPVMAAFLELMDDPHTRFLVLGFSSVIQTITLKCPTALVWNSFGDNKTPPYLNGSPLDVLPNCSPSGLPMPVRQNNQAMRHKVKQAEMSIRERSIAAEARWSVSHQMQNFKNISVVLPVLEKLDNYVFDKIDPSSYGLDKLYNDLFLQADSSSHTATLVHTLCEWATTSKRAGDHRAFVVAKLLERRQADLYSQDTDMNSTTEDGENGKGVVSSPPMFQKLLFNYLDLSAPTVERKQEFANLVFLFFELMCHDVFSHDSYVCQLISRGDIGNSSGRMDEKEDAEGSMEDSKINDDLNNLVSQIKEGNQLSDPFSPPSALSNKAIDVAKSSRHMQYLFHFPLPPDETSLHDINQRHVMLYGAGQGKDEASKNLKRIGKDVLKLFGKKCSIDVSDAKKTKKNVKSDLFENIIVGFQQLSYYDQQALSNQCSTVFIDMLTDFSKGEANFLPVPDYISFLMELAGSALNIQGILDWCIKILKALPGVETQLIERGSLHTRGYTTTLGLYIVAILRRYHSTLILSPSDIIVISDQLLKIAYRPNLPTESCDRRTVLDCNSAEWCILVYLSDLSSRCSFLKSKEKFQELNKFFSEFNSAAAVKPSSYILTDRKFGIEYIANPKKTIDPLTIKLLIENPQYQYNLVCNVLMEVCECDDNEKLTEIATLCCEFTAQCNSLSSHWLAAITTMTDALGSNGYPELLAQLQRPSQAIYNRLGTFVSVLIARHCIPLQHFIQNVCLLMVKGAEETSEQVRNDPSFSGVETGARLSCHLFLKLFQSVDSSRTVFFSSMSPHALAMKSSQLFSGIKYSCDRHLLSSAHNNIHIGFIYMALKAILYLCGDETEGNCDPPPAKKPNLNVSSHMVNFDDDDSLVGLSLAGGSLESMSISELAQYTLQQICLQSWVHDLCLQSPDVLLDKQTILMDELVTPRQAQRLLRMICYPHKDQVSASLIHRKQDNSQDTMLTEIMSHLDIWNLRISSVEIQLIYMRLSVNDANSQDMSLWLDKAGNAIIRMFGIGEDGEQLPGHVANNASVELIPYLIKNLKFLQGRVLKISGHALERGNWSRSSKSSLLTGKEAMFAHQAFLQTMLTCLKELDADCNDEKDRLDKDEQKESLLQSLHTQLSTFLCFNDHENIYDYEDPLARKLMQDSLQLRLGLVGGMFDLIYKNFSSTTEWCTLLVKLVSRGVIDLTKNSDIFVTILDMLATLIHSTLVTDKEDKAIQSERGEESRRSLSYDNLTKKLKKEIGEANSVSIKNIRQLLPLPKVFKEAIVTEPFGTVSDSKGNKAKGLNCDKKQGLQLSDKQKINPWDILEGQKNPAPLSWAWFGAVKHERRPQKYEESFYELRHAHHNLEKDSSYYLEAPPLPPEDLEPQAKISKDGDKSETTGPQPVANPGPPNPMNPIGIGGQNMMNFPAMNMPSMMMAQNGMMRGQSHGCVGPSGMALRGSNMMMNGGAVMRGGGNMGGPRMMSPMVAPNNPMGHNMFANAGGQMMGNTGVGFQSGHGVVGATGPAGNMPTSLSYSGQPYSGAGGVPQMHHMPNINNQRFPAASSMGPLANSKQALQNMLRARHPGPSHLMNQNNQNVAGGAMFAQPRQGYPVRPNMRMPQMNNTGFNPASSIQQQSGPQHQYNSMNSSQYSGNFSNPQMSMNQYVMRQNSGSGYGTPNAMMGRPNPMMQMSSQQVRGSGGAYMHPQAMSMGNMGGGGGNYRQPMVSSGGAMQQQAKQNIAMNSQMRMQSPNVMQNPQLMSQLQRGQGNMGSGQLNYQQNRF